MRKSLWRAVGPGLIWAGTAVGVSHLVQSTRAGAGYGMSLVWVVLLALATKYPGFEAAQRYSAATGTSLLEGYRRQGRIALWLFLAQTLATMCIVEAAVTLVTAGMASALIHDGVSAISWSALLLAACAGLLVVGRYKLLDRAMTALMLLLSISTVVAVLALLPSLDPARLPLWPPLPELNPVHIGFLAALIGWMPAPLDTAVWHSMWTLEHSRSEEGGLDARATRLDFHVGYLGATLLALCFVLLGAGVLHGTGQEIPSSGVAFAALVVDMYGRVLGDWARPLILVAAFTTMVSTTLAVSDGFPRALVKALHRLGGPERAHEPAQPRIYWASLALLMLSSLAIISFFQANLKALVDFATTVSFVIAPLLAVLNYRAVCAAEVPVEHRPGRALRAGHLVSITAMSAFALGYLLYRFG